MNIPFYKLVQEKIKEKFKHSNIVIWYDEKNEFIEEFGLFDEEDINKIAYEGSFIELRHGIFTKDKELTKKWLIYSNTRDHRGFLTEYEYFGEIYIGSIKDILEEKYNINFSKFDISTLDERLGVLRRLWDVIPESTIRNLDQETLDDIVLTKGFGYVDIHKEYTILKYICETEKYDEVLEETKIKDKFFDFVYEEYGILIDFSNTKEEIVDELVINLFQAELIQKSRNKDIRPLKVEIKNPNKIINCVQLLETWANHEIYNKYFVDYSKKISEKYMKNIIKTMEIEDLLGIEYLYGIEEILYKKLEIQILKKSQDVEYVRESLLDYIDGRNINDSEEIDFVFLKKQLKDIKSFVNIRSRYYFSKLKIFNKWNNLNNIFQLLDLLYDFEEQINLLEKNLDDLILSYEKENWWKIDLLYRKVQEDYGVLDDFSLELLDLINKKYHYEYLKPLNEFVSQVIENKVDFKSSLSLQHNFWSQHVLISDKQTAIIIVDALRYEMGREIYSILDEIENKEIHPMISSIPTITEFGMASLLPNGGTKLKVIEENGEIKISDGNFNMPLNNKVQRVKYFSEQAGDKGVVKDLNDILNTPTNVLELDFKDKDRILIFSKEIDAAGHIENSSIQIFPSLIEKIKTTIDKLIQVGIDRILVVSDHGFILTSGLEDWMKVELPKDIDYLVKRRRYAISKNNIEGNYITINSYLANYEGNLYYNFPRGINLFSVPGGAKFYHGGLSLQELLIPVIIIDKKEEEIKVKTKTDQGKQIDLMDYGISMKDYQSKEKATPVPIKEQMEKYIKEKDLSKKEKAILKLFTRASSYTDGEIQEICREEGIKFISKSVMNFMEEFIEKLKLDGYDWIGFRVVGMSTYEYFLK